MTMKSCLIRNGRAPSRRQLAISTDARMVRCWLGDGASCRPIVGIDEAGVASLAGPVVATAVRLTETESVKPIVDRLCDSKRLPSKDAQLLCAELLQHPDVHVHVAVVNGSDVTTLGGALPARLAAISSCAIAFAAETMASRFEASSGRLMPSGPPVILIDGAEVPESLSETCDVYGVPHGDGFFACIAAASIISKGVFDAELDTVDMKHPGWGFGSHRGYPTRRHLERLRQSGPLSGVHRDIEACLNLSCSR